MKRSLRMITFVIGALLTGWTIGRAQSAAPDFELVVNAPGGQTSIECVRGCDLKWVERGLNPNSGLTARFTFSCSASECSSGRVGGWLRR